ncbi:hypothetical protein [Leptospira fluminis]|uniref:hypothetical protein n=1 Tax=Leptospira fluminis TaxID=2484979 RepID=UPI001439E26C|nr:hypothetical protein [Leptospira fluminis]
MKEYRNTSKRFVLGLASLGILFWGFSLFPESLEDRKSSKNPSSSISGSLDRAAINGE